MKKILFLFERSHYFDYASRSIEGYEIQQVSAWRRDIHPLLAKILRNLCYFTSRFALGKWRKQKKSYDLAIFTDVAVNRFTVKYIGKHPVAQRQILYYRNALNKKAKKTVKIARKYGWEVYTYNTSDVKRYGLKYNSQCWNKDLAAKVELITDVNHGVYFLGQVKSRYDTLIQIKRAMEKQGIDCLFQLVSKNGEPETQKERVSYKNYIIQAKKSVALLDVVEEENWGLTLRPLAALFLKKKVVTNYTDMVNYDFYAAHKDNIFIITNNDLTGIKEFLETPFKEVDFDLDYYDNVAWMKRFVEEEN